MTEEELLQDLKPVFEGIYKLTDPDDGHEVYGVFQALPDRKLVDYYKVVKRPISLYMVKTSLHGKKYTNINQFIKDIAQITYNARLFNMKDSQIYNDALTIDNYLKENIEKFRESGKYSEEDLKYPYLGPLPDGSDVEDDQEIDGEAEGDGEDEGDGDGDGDGDDDEEDDPEETEEEEPESDDDSSSKSLKKRGRPSRQDKSNKKAKKEMTSSTQTLEDKRKKRGRPPTVDKPHEHRIKAILRGVRKTKDPDTGRQLYIHFEKPPDPKLNPMYYQRIENPLFLDTIRKKIKRRLYPSVEDFLTDMNIMFENEKMLNPKGTLIFSDAIKLQEAMARIAKDELEKPDSVYQDPDSSAKVARLPLDSIEHNGETYRVGDWVHIKNGNEGCKPTVGQIFRIWQSADGERWINACWYYRPEQTVHSSDKLFFENEVVKSGQYRDHLISEILEKCFVMFFTRYQKGRPKGIGNRSVYCCESRYNEHEKTFNRIRTWKACIPDEVRSTDYPMDLFNKQRPLRRVVSPIKHLLPPNAKETEIKPEPVIGVPNAPPIVGGVYLRPYDPNDPPEEPTPENPDEPPPVLIRDSGSAPTPQPVQPPSSTSSFPTGPVFQTMKPLRVQPHKFIQHRVGPPQIPQIPVQPPAAAVNAVIPPVAPAQFAMPGPGAAPAAFTLAEPLDMSIKPSLGDSTAVGTVRVVLNKPTGMEVHRMVSWYTAPPVWVPRRHVSEPVSRHTTLQFGNGHEDEKVKNVPLGHSAKYLVWKREKLRQKLVDDKTGSNSDGLTN